MRRPALICLLVLAGCGGGGSHLGIQNVARVLGVGPTDDTLSYTVASDGTPVVGRYDSGKGEIKIVSAAGTLGTYPIPGEPTEPIGLTGDFVLASTQLSGGNPYVPYTVDRRTGVTAFLTGDVVATEGNRVVLGTDSGYKLLDLDTGVRTAFTIGDNEDVDVLSGDRVLVSKRIELSGGLVDFRYEVYSTSGRKLSNLPAPEGYVLAEPIGLNAQGEVVGSAYRTIPTNEEDPKPRLVRWSTEGTPTVLDDKTSLVPVGIADDGSILAQRPNGNGAYLFVAGALKPLNLPSVSSIYRYTPEGVIFVEEVERNRVTAYRRR